MAFDLTWTDTGVEIHVDGDFPNQMVAINKVMTSDPRRLQIRYILFNVLDADSFFADAGLVGTLAELDADAYKGGPRMKVAVATRDERMARITQIYAARFHSLNPDGAEYRLFEDLASARAWVRAGKQ